MSVLALLAGVLIASAVYLLLDEANWRRLAGLAFLGEGLAVLVTAAGGGGPTAIRIAIALMLASFAFFLAGASFVRLRRRSADRRASELGQERQT